MKKLAVLFAALTLVTAPLVASTAVAAPERARCSASDIAQQNQVDLQTKKANQDHELAKKLADRVKDKAKKHQRALNQAKELKVKKTKTLAEYQEQLAKANAKVISLNEKIPTLTGRALTKAQKDLLVVQKSITKINLAIETLSADVAELSESVEESTENLESAETEVEEAEDEVEEAAKELNKKMREGKELKAKCKK